MPNNSQDKVFEEIGKLEAETENLKEEIKNCDDKEEAVIGFFATIGKVLKRVFDI